MRGLRQILRAIDNVNERAGRMASFLMLFLAGAAVFEVVARYVFNRPTQWSMEANGFLMLIYVVVGGGYTLLHKGHVNIDVVYSRFSLRGRAILDVATAVIVFAYVIAFIYYGWRFAWDHMVTGTIGKGGWSPPLYPFAFFLPLGGVLLFLQCVAKFMRDLFIVATGKEITSEGEGGKQ